MNIINYEESERAIIDVEYILGDYDAEEKLLILKFITQRLLKKKEQQKINDNLQNVKLGGLIKRVIKGDKKGEEEDA